MIMIMYPVQLLHFRPITPISVSIVTRGHEITTPMQDAGSRTARNVTKTRLSCRY